jgi:hypothetical protein
LGDARAAGAEARCAGAPKSDYLFLSRISTEPKKEKKLLWFSGIIFSYDESSSRVYHIVEFATAAGVEALPKPRGA